MILAGMANGLLPSDTAVDVASLFLRTLLGAFFFLARFRWFYDPSRPSEPWFNDARRKHLKWKVCDCGYGNILWLSCVLAVVEVTAGLGVLVGLLTTLADVGLLVVLSFATFCTAKQKICEQHPVDRIDCVSCYLWRVEGVYITIALVVLLIGPGRYSLDHLIWGLQW